MSERPATLPATGPTDRPDPTPWWRHLGALFPVKIRERVFEPACYERLRRHLDGEVDGRHVPFPVYALAAFVGVAGFNFPRVMFDGRRLSPLGKAIAAALLVTLAAAWAVSLVRYGY